MDRGSQLDEEDEDNENDKDDEEEEEDEEAEGRGRGGRGGRGGRRQATDIKSNNPHLAGGEIYCIYMVMSQNEVSFFCSKKGSLRGKKHTSF